MAMRSYSYFAAICASMGLSFALLTGLEPEDWSEL